MLPFARNPKLRNALRLSSAIIEKIPRRWDSWPIVITKTLSIYEDILKQGEDSARQMINNLGGCKTYTNPHFIQLFFNTDLYKAFDIERVQVNNSWGIVIAKNHNGSIFFEEWYRSGPSVYAPGVWVTKGFDFISVMNSVWGLFGDSLHIDFVEMSNGNGTQLVPQYSSIGFKDFELTSASQKRFNEFIAQQLKYQSEGISRTYLLHGPPGAGKTTFALRVSKTLGTKTLRLGSLGLSLIKANELDFLFSNLSPQVLLIDDVDKANLESSLPRLLTTLSELKIKQPDLVTFFTANKKGFDSALTRPGRIDEILEFEAPGLEERAELLRKLSPKSIPDKTILYLAKMAEGLTPPFIEEIALQLKYKTLYDVSGLVYKMTQTFVNE
jgi:hypothetical protein